MTEPYTIAGETFQVNRPYAEGHVLTAPEAGALNQTYVENIRNNFAGKVKAAKEAGAFDHDSFQTMLDNVMANYVFGQRAAGGTRTPVVKDPVLREALSILIGKVKAAYAKKGATVSAKQVSDKAKEFLADASNPTTIAVMALARSNVEAMNAEGDLDVGDAPAPEAPKEPKAKKAA